MAVEGEGGTDRWMEAEWMDGGMEGWTSGKSPWTLALWNRCPKGGGVAVMRQLLSDHHQILVFICDEKGHISPAVETRFGFYKKYTKYSYQVSSEEPM